MIDYKRIRIKVDIQYGNQGVAFVECQISNVMECPGMSNVKCQLSIVSCLMSNVKYQMLCHNNVKCQMSWHVKCQMSYQCQMSNVMECHGMSNVKCQIPTPTPNQ